MFSNKRKNHWGKIIIVAFVFVLIYGYSLSDTIKDFYEKNTPDKDNKQVEIVSKGNEGENNKGPNSSASANYPQNIIGNNNHANKKISMHTIIRLKTYDSDTNDVVTNEIAVPSSLINLTLEEAETFIQSNYRNWVVSEINEDYIEIYESSFIDSGSNDSENLPGSKPYYLIKEENSIVYIFKFDGNNELESKKQTAINYNLISETDQNLFQNGIKKYSEDEVYELLQDFES